MLGWLILGRFGPDKFHNVFLVPRGSLVANMESAEPLLSSADLIFPGPVLLPVSDSIYSYQ